MIGTIPTPIELHKRIDEYPEDAPRMAALYQMRIAGRSVEAVPTDLNGDEYRPTNRDAYHLEIEGEECIMFMVRTAKTAKPKRGLGPRLRGVSLPLRYDSVAVELFEYFQEHKVPWDGLKYRTYLRRCKDMFKGYQYYVEDYERIIYRMLKGERVPVKTVDEHGEEINKTQTVPMHLRDAGTHIIRHIVIDKQLHQHMNFTDTMLRLYAGHTGKEGRDYEGLTPVQRRYLHMNPRSVEGLEQEIVESLAYLSTKYLANIIDYYKNPVDQNRYQVEIISRLGDKK
jgi:hypothetical protein